MSYRIISKESLLKLNYKEAYVFCCIVLNSEINDNIYISHIREEILAQMAECSGRTISKYINKFKKLKLLNIDTQKIKGEKGIFNRNTYLINKPVDNWFRLEYNFLQEDIPYELKGYLLLLKCIGLKGSNTFLYSLNEVHERKLLNVGLNKIKELTALGISSGVIQKAKTGYTVTDRYIYEDLPYKKGDEVSESYLMNYYNAIVSYCKKFQIKPPKYDKFLMKDIFYNCPSIDLFIDKMNNKNFPKQQIYSLEYFIKTFNFKYSERKTNEKTEDIIMF